MELTWWHDALACITQLTDAPQTVTVTSDGVTHTITLLHWHVGTGLLVCRIGTTAYRWQLLTPLGSSPLRWYSYTHDTTITLHARRPQKKRSSGPTQKVTSLKSPLGGRVLKILVQPGEQVSAHQPLLVIESMKMENEIRAPHQTFIQTISVTIDDVVEAEQLLIVFDQKGP